MAASEPGSAAMADDDRAPSPTAPRAESRRSSRRCRCWRAREAARGLQALARVNQPGGFACPSCAWPEPREHGAIEFCENGAKAVAHEGDAPAAHPRAARAHAGRRAARARRPLAGGAGQTRRADPAPRRAPRHFEPIGWDAAFERVGAELRALASPDQAVFYTSGRASNEAAFLWQLFARQLGTNNLPDCSNLCHESSGEGLGDAIGVGKGTVSLEDIEQAGAIFVIGQNPGTNHPRMLTTLAAAKRRGARIVAINPLRERGLVRFAQPQDPRAWLGRGGRDRGSLSAGARGRGRRAAQGHHEGGAGGRGARPGARARLALPARAHRGLRGAARRSRGAALGRAGGAQRHPAPGHARGGGDLRRRGRRGGLLGDGDHAAPQRRRERAGDPEPAAAARQHRAAGRGALPGARAQQRAGGPHGRHHRAAAARRSSRGWEPSSASSRPLHPGCDTVGAIRALRDGEVRVFLALGGNFAVATPDTARHRGRAWPLPARGADRDHAEPHAAGRGPRSAGAAVSLAQRARPFRRAASSS